MTTGYHRTGGDTLRKRGKAKAASRRGRELAHVRKRTREICGASTPFNRGPIDFMNIPLSTFNFRRIQSNPRPRSCGRLNKPAAIPAALLLVVALFCSGGCATTPGGGHAALLADLRDVATLGAQADLLDHPEHRPYYARAAAALDRLAKLETLTAGDLYAVLVAELPARELRSPKAALYLTGGKILIRRALGERAAEVPGTVRDVAGALRDGLQAAIGNPQPAIR